jgi:hypothetical protein
MKSRALGHRGPREWFELDCFGVALWLDGSMAVLL